ncbi:MAG: tetratricopeptide repeat protein [Kiritimatiellae bacterium]|nr:tetratricopeptide repeat protein [Kiritimatiellia bacterium]
MKRFVAYMVLFASIPALSAGLDVAKQALADGVWHSALTAADEVSLDPGNTNLAERSEARLIALEALAHMEDDSEIRRRLAEWKDETSDRFRYWKVRSLVRVGDFVQAEGALEKPFADSTLELPVACLKASLFMASGKYQDALEVMSGKDIEAAKGLAGEDARLIVAEALGKTDKKRRSNQMLASLFKDASRKEIKLRAGFLLGFSEMEDSATYTTGVDRVKGLLRSNPGDKISELAAKSFADRLLAAGDALGAEDEYRRYFEIFPAAALNVEVLEGRGQALFRLGRFSEASSAFARAEQLVESAEDKARLAYLQASACVSEGKFSSAASNFERSASYGGENAPRACYSQADALERSGEIQRASAIYSELAENGGVWAVKSELRLISISVRNGMLGEAIDRYTKVLESPDGLSDDEVTDAYLGRGRACYRDYRFKEAAADFEIVAARRPALADGMRFLMALCLYGAGRDVEAKKAAVKLMNSTADDELRADLNLWCAKYDYNHGEYKEALGRFVEYASFRKGTSSSADALLWAARCSSAQMEYSKAVELATQAANCAGADKSLFMEALFVQGEAVMELGRYPEAAQLFDRVASQAGEGALYQKALMLKADALYAMGAGDMNRYEEAIGAYRMLFDAGGLSPDLKIEASFKIARALEKLRRTKDAMDQYYKNVVLSYFEETSKGVLLGAPARTFFSRAAFYLVDYYIAAGESRAVKKILERVVASDVPAAKEAKRRLEEMNLKGLAE